jgi:hypothetical protein
MPARRKSFSFYPTDWLKDPDLRRCSLAARGVWVDVLCLMFECESPGVLQSEGRAWPRVDLARAIGGNEGVVMRCLEELEAKGILQRDGNGAYACSHMVAQERARSKRQEAARRRRDAKPQAIDKPKPSKHVEDSSARPSVVVEASVDQVARPQPKEISLSLAKLVRDQVLAESDSSVVQKVEAGGSIVNDLELIDGPVSDAVFKVESGPSLKDESKSNAVSSNVSNGRGEDSNGTIRRAGSVPKLGSSASDVFG